MKRKIYMMISFSVILVMMWSCLAYSDQVEQIKPNQIVILGSSTKENGYNAYVHGDAVNFRSSPHLYTNNIKRVLYTGHRLWGYYSGLYYANNDGYWWSYVLDVVNNDWGFIATKYFTLVPPPPKSDND